MKMRKALKVPDLMSEVFGQIKFSVKVSEDFCCILLVSLMLLSFTFSP
jgi:hypothetical protein